MKIVFVIIAIIIVFVILIIGVGGWMFKKEMRKDQPEYIVQFMKERVSSESAALSIYYNGQKWVAVNEDLPLPLASTVKIIIAIEYAKQAAGGQINPEQLISIEDLAKFYIPKTDGGAHQAWLNQLEGKTSVPLHEVARGMILYSSNANTEYLIERLGLDQINQTVTSLALSQHETLYPFVSAMVLPAWLMQEQQLSQKELLPVLNNMSQEEYIRTASEIQRSFMEKPLTNEQKKKIISPLSLDVQKNWSNRLTKASVADYISILQKLNNKSYFNESIHLHLDPIMEQLMENSANREWLLHAGQKGGSTAFVCTQAFYAKEKIGNQLECAFFANELNPIERAKMSKNINSFQLKFLKDEEFRNFVKKELAIYNA